MEDKIVAVIGAGTIGADVALTFALHDFNVLLKDLNLEILEKAKKNISSSYRFTKMMTKGDTLPSLENVLNIITFTTDYQDFKKAGLVIENITEDYEKKKIVFSELNELCGAGTIFGSNTSCIPIKKIASLMNNPENVIGTHFMNPVPLSKLVEVVKGSLTSETTLERTKKYISDLHKTYVVVNDAPGFVTNRVLMLTINESIWTVHDQVASPKDVDVIFKLGFGHTMGPLATADLIGLDTILNSLNVLYESYNDPKFRPCPLLIKMVENGMLGKKSGKGFYNYTM